jgi:FlaA1/EpsC-like NDP-sugar epimerase
MIEFVGLKDGEKQSEHLRYDYEFVQGEIAPQLYQIGGNEVSDPETFALNLDRLVSLVTHRRKAGLLESLFDFVPEFSPSSTLLRQLG